MRLGGQAGSLSLEGFLGALGRISGDVETALQRSSTAGGVGLIGVNLRDSGGSDRSI